ncbi:MAG: tripartite tricarboxylate transporter substrate binding protein, partial [Xanthobacteraceae bacterium]|nr:tripartite tricarboxylate transporter substrate binding protein [Xanthobacteraceae bacterium]
VPFAPGAGSDIVARITAEKMSEGLSQPVVVENKSGAGGMLANRYVAGAVPDGYTLLLMTGAYPAQAAMLKELSFDPMKDVSMISLLMEYPFVLIARPDAPYKSVKELIAYAKGGAVRLNYASSGAGSVHHLTSELFNAMTGIDAVPITYRGGSVQILELLAGRVDFVFETLPSAASALSDGRVRALAVTSGQRWPALPEVPTVSEALPGFDVISFLGIATTGRTPTFIIDRLGTEMRRVLALADVRERFRQLGGEVASIGATEMETVVEDQIRKWQYVIAARGIERQ